jgi:hypothetical protein
MTMEHLAHQFSEGDRVRTLRRVGRLPAGSIGTVQTVLTCDVLNVLFAHYRAPFLIYYDRLEAPPPQNQEDAYDAENAPLSTSALFCALH